MSSQHVITRTISLKQLFPLKYPAFDEFKPNIPPVASWNEWAYIYCKVKKNNFSLLVQSSILLTFQLKINYPASRSQIVVKICVKRLLSMHRNFIFLIIYLNLSVTKGYYKSNKRIVSFDTLARKEQHSTNNEKYSSINCLLNK